MLVCFFISSMISIGLFWFFVFTLPSPCLFSKRILCILSLTTYTYTTNLKLIETNILSLWSRKSSWSWVWKFCSCQQPLLSQTTKSATITEVYRWKLTDMVIGQEMLLLIGCPKILIKYNVNITQGLYNTQAMGNLWIALVLSGWIKSLSF